MFFEVSKRFATSFCAWWVFLAASHITSKKETEKTHRKGTSRNSTHRRWRSSTHRKFLEIEGWLNDYSPWANWRQRTAKGGRSTSSTSWERRSGLSIPSSSTRRGWTIIQQDCFWWFFDVSLSGPFLEICGVCVCVLHRGETSFESSCHVAYILRIDLKSYSQIMSFSETFQTWNLRICDPILWVVFVFLLRLFEVDSARLLLVFGLVPSARYVEDDLRRFFEVSQNTTSRCDPVRAAGWHQNVQDRHRTRHGFLNECFWCFMIFVLFRVSWFWLILTRWSMFRCKYRKDDTKRYTNCVVFAVALRGEVQSQLASQRYTDGATPLHMAAMCLVMWTCFHM